MLSIRLGALSWSVLIGLTAVPFTGYAQIATIREHYDRARNVDPNFIAATAAREAAEKGTDVAQSALGPKVSLSMSAFRTDRIETSRNILGQSVDTARRFDTQNAVIQARQPVYRKREALGVDQAQAQQAAAEKILLFAEQDLQSRLVSAWIEVLAARTLVATYSDAYRASQEFLAEAERRRKAGESTVQDLEQARARLVQSEGLLEDARARLAVADQALTLIAGPESRVPGAMALGFFSVLPISIKSENEVIDLIERSNLEVASARFQEEAAKIEREKAQSDRMPTVDAFASATKGQNDSLNFIKDEQRVGLQLSVPIYTHGAIDAGVAQADANYRRQKAQTQATIFRVRNEAVTAFNNLGALQIRIRAADRIAEAATMLLKAQQLGVKAGVNSRGEVAQAMTDLLTAQRDRALIRKDYAIAWLKLQVAIGSLSFEQLELLQGKLVSAGSSASQLQALR